MDAENLCSLYMLLLEGISPQFILHNGHITRDYKVGIGNSERLKKYA